MNLDETDSFKKILSKYPGYIESVMKIYVYLSDKNEITVSNKTIGDELGYSSATIKRGLSILHEVDLIIKKESRPGFPTCWKTKHFEKESQSTFIYCFCYMDKNGNHIAPIKIGRAKDIKNRLKQNQTGNPFKIYNLISLKFDKPNDVKAIEKTLHLEFKEFNTNGEWFDIKPEYLKDLLEKRFPNNVCSEPKNNEHIKPGI